MVQTIIAQGMTGFGSPLQHFGVLQTACDGEILPPTPFSENIHNSAFAFSG